MSALVPAPVLDHLELVRGTCEPLDVGAGN